LPLAERPTRLRDDADILVAHDDRVAHHRIGVHLDVGTADAGHLDLHQRGVIRDVWHRILAELGGTGAGPHRRQNLLSHAYPCRSSAGRHGALQHIWWSYGKTRTSGTVAVTSLTCGAGSDGAGAAEDGDSNAGQQ